MVEVHGSTYIIKGKVYSNFEQIIQASNEDEAIDKVMDDFHPRELKHKDIDVEEIEKF